MLMRLLGSSTIFGAFCEMTERYGLILGIVTLEMQGKGSTGTFMIMVGVALPLLSTSQVRLEEVLTGTSAGAIEPPFGTAALV